MWRRVYRYAERGFEERVYRYVERGFVERVTAMWRGFAPGFAPGVYRNAERVCLMVGVFCCTGEAKVPWTPGRPGKGVCCI
jgi:hypothetical protein